MKTRFFSPLAASLMVVMLLSYSFTAEAQRKRGSRNVVSEVRQLPWFDSVKVSGSIDLVITQGDTFHVEVFADDNLISDVVTTVRDNVLEIGMISGFSFRTYNSLKVNITAPRFTSIQTSGSSDITGNGTLTQEDLRIRSSGASDVRLNVNVKYLEIEFSGASDAILAGQALSVKAKFSGSSDFKARELVCDFLEIELSGASDATLTVENEVAGSLGGASDLRIVGNPKMKVRTSGASSVKTNL